MACHENDPVTAVIEMLAEMVLDKIGIVVANDSARSSFTVAAGDSLLALDPGLKVLGQWPSDARSRGWHSTSPGRGLALISGPDEVRLLDRRGRVLWRHQHTAWSGAFESGCTWFDWTGQPHAVVPAPSYDGCLVLRLDLESGQPLAQAPIGAAPAGVSPVHHRDGWVGLSEGEGQDAARAWWVRSAGQLPGQIHIEILDAGWDDWVLSDVDPSGTKVITTPHNAGPLFVRAFPSLEVLRAIDPPGQEAGWDFTACFAGDLLIAKLIGPHERLVAIGHDDIVHDLDEQEYGWLIPAAHGTWLAATRTTIRRCRIPRSDKGGSATG
jgi:hypothetical protein